VAPLLDEAIAAAPRKHKNSPGMGTASGAWAYGWGRQDDQDSIAAIHHALDQGINWIDTAAVYGLGLQDMPRDGDAELQDQPDATSVGQQCRLRERVTVHKR
jgi:hypothetical protein